MANLSKEAREVLDNLLASNKKENTMMTWEGGGGPLPPNTKRNIMNKEIKALIINDKKNSERVIFNMKKALSLDADISYKDTENGTILVSITKNGQTTTEEFDSIPQEIKDGIDRAMAIRHKKVSKNQAKNSVNVRYKIGDILILRGKIRDGSPELIKKFEVKKVIWSIKEVPVNILILKQLEGVNNNMSLTKNDCKRYHIKYEEGLQVYSMGLNFIKRKKKS